MWRLITPPSVEPISLAEAKLQCSVESDITELDTWFSNVAIPAARAACEHETGRKLIQQTWERVLDAFPATSDRVELGMLPVQSVTGVYYLDGAGVEQTWSSSNYTLDSVRLPGYLSLAYGAQWPAAREVDQAVRIRVVAGYGAAASAVPAELRQWMLMRIATMHMQREQFSAGVGMVVQSLPDRYTDSLLDAYRIFQR